MSQGVPSRDADATCQSIAQMMLDLCSRLGVMLLVEGVETLDELDLFARMGVPLAQGFVFGQPRLTPQPLIDDDLAVRLKFRAGLRRRADVVAPLVDVAAQVEVVDGAAAVPPVEETSDVQPVVLVDGAGRPVGLRVGTGHWQQTRPAVTVTVTEQIVSAAERAMSRPPGDRALPLVCVDRTGRHVGVIPVAAIVRALAMTSGQPATLEVVLA